MCVIDIREQSQRSDDKAQLKKSGVNYNVEEEEVRGHVIESKIFRVKLCSKNPA